MFPESFTFSIADWVNGWVDSLVTNYGDVFRHISDTLLWAIVNLEGLLRAAPWWLMLAIVGGIAWHATRKVVTDRKSTRLNSSHLGISYAVFCLKKKKKN